MLFVKATVGPSKIHGLGLFAAEDIKAGTVVKAWNPTFDCEFSTREYRALSDLAQDFLAHFGWPFPGGVRVSLDNSRYTNHSTDPNLVPINGEVRAKRDIEIGEELTENYGNDWKR